MAVSINYIRAVSPGTFGATQVLEEAGSVSNVAAGGSIGAAAATVDLYSVLAINQTTADKVLTFPTPTDSSRYRKLRVANVGSAAFYAYGRFIRAGAAEDFMYVPALGWRRMHSGAQVIAQRGAPLTAPNDTSTNTLETVTLPGTVMGATGAIRITHTWTMGGSTNSKTLRIQFGGTSFFSTAIVGATQVLFQGQVLITNRGSVSSQVGANSGSNGFGASTAGAQTASVNTDSDVSIAFIAIKDAAAVAAGDAIALERYTVELLRFD